MKRLTPILAVAAAWSAALIWTGRERRRRLFSPDPYPRGNWTVIPPSDRQELIIPTPDGETLHAWFLESAGAHDPILIWFHGAGGNLTGRAEVANRIRNSGVSVLLFDWRGYGRSTGSPSEAGLKRDALAARDWVARHFSADHPVILYGESLGGPFAAWTAAHRSASAVILENTFPSLAALANVEYDPLPVGLMVPFSMRTVDWLNNAALPVLVIHGRRDETVPFKLGIRLYNELDTPRALLVSETAGHNQVAWVDPDRYDEAVIDFIRATTTGHPDLFGDDGR